MLDFDEILVRVKNPNVKKYLGEAIKSYHVGNYRSAIISSWIAAMFDLVKKFEILVNDSEPTAKEHWKKIKPKIKEHHNWEKELIQGAKSADMISKYEYDTLENLRNTRNKYAHPSFDDIGDLFDPTPEEVRYFIRTLYDLVFSQPVQLGALYVNELRENIKAERFFRDRPLLDDFRLSKGSVLERYNKINKRQLPRLIKLLFEDFRKPENSNHQRNIICFIINLWGNLHDETSLIISKEIDGYIEDRDIDNELFIALINYPEKIINLSEKSLLIINKFFEYKVLNITKIDFYRNSIKKIILSSDILKNLNQLFEIFIAKLIEEEGLNGKFVDYVLYQFFDINIIRKKYGPNLLEHFREALRTENGYIVNPALDRISKYGLWELAEDLTDDEKNKFADELIESIRSNNFGTMDLLGYQTDNNIPSQWISKILNQWTKSLIDVDDRVGYYKYHNTKYYLNLAYRYEELFGEYEDLKTVFQILQEYNGESIIFGEFDREEKPLEEFCKKLKERYKKEDYVEF